MALRCLSEADYEIGGAGTFIIRLGIGEPWPRIVTRPLVKFFKEEFPSAVVEALDDDGPGAVPRTWRLPFTDYEKLMDRIRQVEGLEDDLPDALYMPKFLQRAFLRRVANELEEPLYFSSSPSSSWLLPFQREGIAAGVARGGKLLLADDMGLGKTVQAIGIASQWPGEWPVLVVCPSSLRGVWQDQLQQWSGVASNRVQIIWNGADEIDPNSQWVIVSYALLARHEKLRVRAVNSEPYSIVVLDECHYAKNPSAERTEASISVLGTAKRRILLSGTAVLNASWELHPLLSALDDEFPDLKTFMKRYFAKEDHKFGKKVCTEPIRELELHEYLKATVMVRRLKRDVLKQLPSKRRQVVQLEGLNMKAIRELQKQEKAVFAEDEHGSNFRRSLQSVLGDVADIKLDSVCEYVEGLIEGNSGKFLLFAHHRRVLDRLEQVLKNRLGTAYIRVDGSTSQQLRPELVRRFQEDASCHVALLSITALAEGQTLTSAEMVIFAELSWVPGIIEQCEARAHRLGQQGSVLVQFLMLRGSRTDEQCYKRLSMKHRHAGLVLDGAAPPALFDDQANSEIARDVACRGIDSGGLRAKARCRPQEILDARLKAGEGESTSASASMSAPAASASEPKRRRKTQPTELQTVSAKEALASAARLDGSMCVKCNAFPASTRKGVKRGFCCNKCPNHGPWCTSHEL